MDEHNDVGVLFNCAGFAKMAQAGTVVFRHFGHTVKLGQAQDRDVEFAREPFKTPRNLSDLLLTGIKLIIRLDEAEVVDNNEAQPNLTLKPPRDRAYFRYGVRRSVVNIDRRFAQIVCGLSEILLLAS